MKKILCLAAVAAVFCGCSSNRRLGVEELGPEQVLGEGTAVFNDKDLEAAKRLAIADAQKNAVAQAADIFISDGGDVKNSAFEQKILSKPENYVLGYKIISEGREGGYYKTRIRAKIAFREINAVIGEIKPVRQKSGRAAVLITESISGQTVQSQDARIAIMKALKKEKYHIVENRVSGAGPTATEFSAEFARRSGADFIITGSVSADKISSMAQLGPGFIPFRAKANIKILSAATGKVITQFSREAGAVDSTENIAAQKAITSVGELVALEALKTLGGAVSSGTTIKVAGLSGIAQVKEFLDILRATPGIGPVSLSHYRRGEAWILTDTNGISAEEIIASMLRKISFNLQTQSIGLNEIQFKANSD
ncbi:MAG: hypothetical protein NTW04_03070 [Elusimicrobia bacterium]|nr:hypothetical protein [Elusimicrobiota bacterium]